MLLLNAHQLVRYLVRAYPAKPQELRLRLRTQNLSSEQAQNQCLLAYWGEAETWFVKQPYFPERYEPFGIANEARFYRLVESRTGRARGMFLSELKIQLADPSVMKQLHRLSDDEWREECLIHGDAAWRNWLFKTKPPGSVKVELRLVDWERASWGDSRWDHALFIEGYVRNGIDPRPYADRFFRAYYAKPRPNYRRWLDVVLRLTALNLIQNTFERFTNVVGTAAERNAQERALTQECRRWFKLFRDPIYFLDHLLLPTNYDPAPRKSIAKLD